MASWVCGTARSRRGPYQESKEPVEAQESGFCQKSLNEVRGMCWSIVVMEAPIFCWPQVLSLAPHSICGFPRIHLIVISFLVLRWFSAKIQYELSLLIPLRYSPQFANKTIESRLYFLRFVSNCFIFSFNVKCFFCALFSYISNIYSLKIKGFYTYFLGILSTEKYFKHNLNVLRTKDLISCVCWKVYINLKYVDNNNSNRDVILQTFLSVEFLCHVSSRSMI